MDKDKNLNRIKAVLAEKHVTSKWLAEQLGKSTCTVSKWCSQKNAAGFADHQSNFQIT